jgi:hypothetical protein
MSLPRFSISCTPLEQDEKVKTSFDGPPPKNSCSLLASSTMSLFVIMAFISLKKVFGGPRFL